MPTPISQLAEIPQADFTDNDQFVVVDVDDITQAPTGTTKKVSKLRAFTNIIARGALTFADAVSKLIPGVTSFSIRNNGDTQDNLLVTDAGDVTIRQDGIIGRHLKFLLVAAKIIPGATSLTIRNNADSQDNIAITDSGVMTVRGGITMASGSAPIKVGKLQPVSGGFVVRDDADTQDNFRVFDSTGAIEARGSLNGTRVVLSGDPNHGQINFTATSAPAVPGDGKMYWDGTKLYIYDGSTRYSLDMTLAP